MLRIPWWVKILIKIFLSRIPIGYKSWHKIGLFRHGKMDSAEYSIKVFNSHKKKADIENLNNKTILEIGPGDSIATAIIAASEGASSILIDSGFYAETDSNFYINLINHLKIKKNYIISESKEILLSDILSNTQSKYLTKGLKSWSEIEDESIDFIFSQAVLEHIPKNEFRQTMRECHRVLKQNGVISHKIDLKDHLGGALNNLRFNEILWESNFLSKSGFYTNRIQFSEMLNYFSSIGFQSKVLEINRWVELPTKKRKMNNKFRQIPDEELLISEFDVLLRK